MNRWITNAADLHEAYQFLKNLKFPFKLSAVSGKPTDEDGLAKWRRQNAFFHRSICPAYSEFTGMDERECKEDLQSRFACVVEGEEVEAISGMSNARLAKFIEDCQQFLAVHGVFVEERIYGKTKLIK